MAQMPRGGPRSVPDPAGEAYDEMIRKQRLAQQIADAVGGGLPREPFSPVANGVTSRFSRPSATPSVVVRNGRLVCVTPPDRLTVSPAELAQRQQAIERVALMVNSPLAGAGYGAAAMAGASPEVRDRALMAGAIADTALLGVAPRAALPRSPPPAPRAPAAQVFERPAIRLNQTNAYGQAQGMNATLAKPLGFGSKPDRRIKPPGWSGHGRKYNEGRGHLLAESLGGSGLARNNLVTLTQNPTNGSHMQSFEREVARRVRAGEAIEYAVTPSYTEGVLPPGAILLTAHGPREGFAARIIDNPAGRRR